MGEVKPSLNTCSQPQQKVPVVINATKLQVCDTAMCCGVA